MPELPEVETVRRGLEPALVGAKLVAVRQNRPDLRFPFPSRFKERLLHQTVIALSRRAKYLLAELSSGEVLIMHLGMSGRFIVDRQKKLQAPGGFHRSAKTDGAHAHVEFELSNGVTITYHDARRFGFMDLVPKSELLESRHFAEMGLEPLGNELSGEAIATLFKGRRTPLKAALLDQRLIAGLGNIYVCEALFRTGLDPRAPAGSLATSTGKPKEKAHRLAAVIRDVLNEAIAAGGSTLRDHAQVDGSLGYFQHVFQVYGRENKSCENGCGAKIERIVQAGRSTFYCPRCQR